MMCGVEAVRRLHLCADRKLRKLGPVWPVYWQREMAWQWFAEIRLLFPVMGR
jgi:hypothetical protein